MAQSIFGCRGNVDFSTTIKKDKPMRINVPERIINGKRAGIIRSYQSCSPVAASERLKVECVRIQYVRNRNKIREIVLFTIVIVAFQSH